MTTLFKLYILETLKVFNPPPQKKKPGTLNSLEHKTGMMRKSMYRDKEIEKYPIHLLVLYYITDQPHSS